MSQERRVAAALYLWFYVTFVHWYRLPRQGSLSASSLETWPLGGLSLWGDLLSPFWNRPCLYLLCMASLTGFFWMLLPRARLEQALPGLLALLLFKLALVAADMRLLSPAHNAHLWLTAAFLLTRPRLFFMRVTLAALALGAALEGGYVFLYLAAGGSLLALTPQRRAGQLGVALYLAVQSGIWWWRGLTAPVSHTSFEDSGFLLVAGALILIPCHPSGERRSWPGWVLLGMLLLAQLSLVLGRPLTGEGRWLDFWEPEAPRRVLARYSFEHDGFDRCEVLAEMPLPASWTDRPRVRLQAQIFSDSALVRDLKRLDRSITRQGQVIFAPARFRLASPETMADPAFHLDYLARVWRQTSPRNAALHLFVGKRELRCVLALPSYQELHYRRWGNNPFLLPGSAPVLDFALPEESEPAEPEEDPVE